MKLYQELGLDLWKTEDGWHHFFICIRFDPQNYSLTPMNLPAIVILLVTKLYIVEQIYFETLFYISVLTNGLNWILISDLSILMQC